LNESNAKRNRNYGVAFETLATESINRATLIEVSGQSIRRVERRAPCSQRTAEPVNRRVFRLRATQRRARRNAEVDAAGLYNIEERKGIGKLPIGCLRTKRDPSSA